MTQRASTYPESHSLFKVIKASNDYPRCPPPRDPTRKATGLLKKLSGLVHPHGVDWTIDRVRFKPQFTQTNFTTCTDGALIVHSNNSIIAFVEAKRGLRVKGPD
ncbi:hypothetical protein BJX62DRAFT_232034 [Aspergillus germanicus]